jgi:glycosyltransferase involved in cell wall biosynthesis
MSKPKTTDSMRLLHVVGDSRFGGAGRIILGLGQAARAKGWQVDVLATDPVFQRSIREQGLGVVDLDVIRREIRPHWDLAGLLRLYRFLRRERYRLVHTHTSKAGFVGRLAARLAGVPAVVHTVHGFAFHEESPSHVRWFYSALERMAAPWCDRLVSVSEFHRDWALALGICDANRILAIPNGITPPVRNPEVAPAEVRRRLGVPDDDRLILTMARLAADKGLAYLIEAVAMLPPALNVRLAIAGDGPVRTRLEQVARARGVTGRVNFLGFREDVGDLLAACDLVALPSLREGLSIALLEAMSAGKPIIASSIGSHRELAEQADIALLVPPADARALRDAIMRLAGDPALMTRLGASARALFERHYTEGRMLDSYLSVYSGLLEGKTPAKDIAARRVSPSGRPPEWAMRQPKGGGI